MILVGTDREAKEKSDWPHGFVKAYWEETYIQEDMIPDSDTFLIISIFLFSFKVDLRRLFRI